MKQEITFKPKISAPICASSVIHLENGSTYDGGEAIGNFIDAIISECVAKADKEFQMGIAKYSKRVNVKTAIFGVVCYAMGVLLTSKITNK